MPRANDEPRRWTLQARLLLPFVGLVSLVAISFGLIENFRTHREVDALANQRAQAELEEISSQLRQRQRSKEIFAQLLADQNRLAGIVERGDPISLAQLLVPLQAKLGLGFVGVYDNDSRELLHLGPRADRAVSTPLITAALSGLSKSAAAVSGAGMMVSASAPIKGPRGIVGAVEVGKVLNSNDLQGMVSRQSVEVAVFREGRLAATTVDEPAVARLLRETRPTREGLAGWGHRIARYKLYVAVKPLTNAESIMVLVPTGDLLQASRERTLIGLIAALVLAIGLLLAGMVLIRDITGPVKSMVAVAEEMSRGNYHLRAPPSSISELEHLRQVINHLTEQIEIQLTALRTEIAERKRAEARIKASLKEKEVLLKEIHHRVNNNLQVISSLLSLQSKTARDEHSLETLRDSQNRIKSMAIVHERLYRSQDLARVDFGEYARNLMAHLYNTYAGDSRSISVKVNADAVLLDVDTAILCGLIINELVSNSLKHGFPGDASGEICIELHQADLCTPTGDQTISLKVSDNGVGFPAHVDFRKTESLGLQLVTALVEQLGGEIRLHSDGGTEFTITLTVPTP